MRHARAASLRVAALPARAQDFPKLKPGLWEMTHVTATPHRGDRRARSASTHSIQQDMIKMSSGHDGRHVQQVRAQVTATSSSARPLQPSAARR
jgi:hypothetical protein